MPVPKIIHFIWAGGTKPFPPQNAERIKAWAKQNPEFEVRLWIDKETTPKDVIDSYSKKPYLFNDDPKIVLKDISDEGVVDEYSRYHIDKMVPNYGASSDVLRYAILKKIGGAFFDSDVLVGDKPLNYDALFDSAREEILKINQSTQGVRSIGNDGFICTPEHPFMTELYELAKKNHRTRTKITYGEYGTYRHMNYGIYNFDSIQQLYGGREEFPYRMLWTINCTGPEAVREVCRSRDMLAVELNPRESSTKDPYYALDTKTFRAALRNDGNWIALRVTKYDNPEDAIRVAVKAIKFETKNMGILALDYHILLIMSSLKVPIINEKDVAVKLVEALKKDAPELSTVTQVQLLSIHPVVREYYRQYTPHADDNLQACELGKFSWDTSTDSLFSSIKTESERSAVVDYSKHVLNLVNTVLTTQPENITMVHLSKLLLVNHFINKIYEDLSDSSVVDAKKELAHLIQQVLPQAVKQIAKDAQNADEMIAQFQALLASDDSQSKNVILAVARIGLVMGGRFVSDMLEVVKNNFAAMQANSISQSLCIYHKRYPTMIDSQFMAQVAANPIGMLFQDFPKAIECLEKISPSLVNGENIKLLGSASKHIDKVASGLKILFKASNQLANSTTLKLLKAQNQNAEEAATSLVDLHKQLVASASHSQGLFHLPTETVNKMRQFISGTVGISFNENDIEALKSWKFESKYGNVIKLDSLAREQPSPEPRDTQQTTLH